MIRYSAVTLRAQGSAALFTALLKNPKITSFVVMREPDIEKIDADALHGILHPVFAPFDPEGPIALLRSARSLNAVLPQISCPKFSNPNYFKKEFAAEM